MNKTQAALRDRILCPCREGVRLELVHAQYLAGDEMLESLERETADGNGVRVVAVGAEYGDWGAICALSKITDTTGGAHTERLWNALQALSNNGARPLALVIDDAHFLKARQMEAFVLCAERVARKIGMSMRLFLVSKKSTYYREKVADNGKLCGEYERANDFPQYPPLFAVRQSEGLLRVWELKRGAMDVMNKTEAREEIEQRLIA